MSDPLTALMHAVQVMNLLKTLIMRTLRKREETVQEGYSSMSSRSSDRATDEEEYDSQQDMDTSCESTGPASEDDDDEQDSHYNHSSDEKDEVESLSDIEERFLRQLDENENAKNDFRKQLQGILLCRENVSPTSASTTFNGDSCLSLSDSKIGSSSCFTITSDEEHSRTSSIVMGLSSTDAKEGVLAVSRSTTDVEMVENMAESALPMQLCILK